ncbi:MAG: hypothetical protein AMJ38_05620 [Dehalococcoidia bacterium DG_22]|nr:MAG: hypothetical protein AMJ38_05620 [Dehalococcoidia bacterium DG_22]
MKFCIIETALGWLGLVLSSAEEARDGGLGDLSDRLCRYARGEPVAFPDALDFAAATPFQRAVWQATQEIPYGQTRSYGWLAARVGKPRAARAVGQAMAANPWPIIVPCHRVISSNGRLGGYGGGLDMKERLLLLEGAIDG